MTGDAVALWQTRRVRRPMRLPDAADVLALLAGGQRPGARVGWWVDATGDDVERWWTSALRLVEADRARRAA